MSEVKIYLHTLPLGGFIRAIDEQDYLKLQQELSECQREYGFNDHKLKADLFELKDNESKMNSALTAKQEIINGLNEDLACALTDLSDTRREVEELSTAEKAATMAANDWVERYNQERARAQALLLELEWVHDGIQHFTHDDNHEQVLYLSAGIERAKAKHNSGKGG